LPIKFHEINSERKGETSAEIRVRVIAARLRQQKGFTRKPKINCSARIGPKELKEFCALDDGTKETLKAGDEVIKFQRRCTPFNSPMLPSLMRSSSGKPSPS
jgi:magnesium chelatase family protein